jgi:hypothetical protein
MSTKSETASTSAIVAVSEGRGQAMHRVNPAWRLGLPRIPPPCQPTLRVGVDYGDRPSASGLRNSEVGRQRRLA